MLSIKYMVWNRKMTRYFCTYFDSHYLIRGLAMCRSLAQHSPDINIFVLALDDICFEFLENLGDHPYLIPVRLKDLEAFDQELFNCRDERSPAEYIFTMTPCLPRYLLLQKPEIDIITYLDADLYFFSSPEPIFTELSDGHIAITPHRFAKNVQYMAADRGEYNVAWISFRNNVEGNKCLNWYRERCLEWCYDRVEDGKFADQKYLEHFSEIAECVISIKNKGADLAPWNLGNGGLELRNDTIFIDGDKLIFFHYQGLVHCIGQYYDCGLFAFRLRLSRDIRRMIFCTYIQAICALKREYSLDLPAFTYGNRYISRFPLLAKIGSATFRFIKICLGYCVSC